MFLLKLNRNDCSVTGTVTKLTNPVRQANGEKNDRIRTLNRNYNFCFSREICLHANLGSKVIGNNSGQAIPTSRVEKFGPIILSYTQVDMFIELLQRKTVESEENAGCTDYHCAMILNILTKNFEKLKNNSQAIGFGNRN